jgi:NADH-quinone oxidoreductase subunit N
MHLLLPEIFMLGMICIILVVDAFLSEKHRDVTYHLAQGTVVITAVLTFLNSSNTPVYLMNHLFVSDALSLVLKLAVFILISGVFLYSKDYLKDRNLYKGEFFIMVLTAMLGMQVMISAHHLLTLYLGLELLALSLYGLVAMHRDSAQAAEAAMKYFVLGALASGMLLYGMSMLYGLTGSLQLDQIAQVIAKGELNRSLLNFSLAFILAGLAFKLGAVPFHVWLPDVYQGAPTSMTLLMGTAPKIAGFALLMRLLTEGLGGLHADWKVVLIVLAILSMGFGNIVAIAQTNIKRMLAYSTISHMGFLMLGILTGTIQGYNASLFYVLAYSFMSLGAFGMIILLSRAGFEAEQLDDFKGLNERSPWLAFLMLIFMLSMAGVPPMLGFWAKWSVLSQVVAAGFFWLAVLAVLFSVIGAYYYLRIVKLMYFDKSQDNTTIEPSSEMRAVISVNALGILVLGLSPQILVQLCNHVFK